MGRKFIVESIAQFSQLAVKNELNFTANPVPVYKWLKNGRELTDFSPEQYYKIESVRREDAGSYQCVAKNDVGSVLSQKIDVTVACKWTRVAPKIIFRAQLYY